MSHVSKLLNFTHRRRFTEEEISEIIMYNNTADGDELWDINADPLPCWAVIGDHGSLLYATNEEVIFISPNGIVTACEDLDQAMGAWINSDK